MIVFGGSPHHGSAKVADEAFGDALFLSLLESLFHLVNVLRQVYQSKLCYFRMLPKKSILVLLLTDPKKNYFHVNYLQVEIGQRSRYVYGTDLVPV